MTREWENIVDVHFWIEIMANIFASFHANWLPHTAGSWCVYFIVDMIASAQVCMCVWFVIWQGLFYTFSAH